MHQDSLKPADMLIIMLFLLHASCDQMTALLEYHEILYHSYND